ncbi:metallophosphoesterase [Desemzia sp. RIT804]|uniref:metallophosphoesterase n=1 Tax=Desemzia sp. RIT 804 TaxID=2810209 RepID=UPI0019523FB0|nr:metallophosphoesterase [Desemzia sp. RIT 804]MBM6613579.1 metallophosphoesterase [Desemzia sp. RIT 804]
MKKKLLIGFSLFILVALFFMTAAIEHPTEPVKWERDPITPTEAISKNDAIWVITDLHYLSPSLFDHGESFNFIKETSAGKDLDYPAQRMEALIWQIEKERPKLLLVSGDLTLNGEKQSAVELADYFQQIEERGTQVYVIPGNHDISNGWARKFVGDEQEKTKQILPEDFQTIFSDMGYKEAYTLDEHSLSYAVKPYTNLTLLMLDTNVYTQTEGKGAPPSNGRLKKETLAWIESVFEDAKKTGAIVLPVLHHNLLEHNDFMTNGFTLDNEKEVKALFLKYTIPVVFTGHTHVQDIANEQNRLYDITTAAFSVMTPSFGKVIFDGNQFHYEKQVVNVESWALETNQTDNNLLTYTDYATNLFVEDGINMGLRQLIEEQWYDDSYAEEVGAFVGESNRLFFSGEASQISTEDLDQMKEEPGYQTIKKHSKGFLLRYMDNILKTDGHSNLNLSFPLSQSSQ